MRKKKDMFSDYCDLMQVYDSNVNKWIENGLGTKLCLLRKKDGVVMEPIFVDGVDMKGLEEDEENSFIVRRVDATKRTFDDHVRENAQEDKYCCNMRPGHNVNKYYYIYLRNKYGEMEYLGDFSQKEDAQDAFERIRQNKDILKRGEVSVEHRYSSYLK
jgi:hypothetical protein